MNDVIICASVKLVEKSTPYDQKLLIADLRKLFGNIQVEEGCQLAKSAELAEKSALSEDAKIKEIIVKTLWRNAEMYGPAIGVRIPTATGFIQGSIRPSDITFTSDTTSDPSVWNKLIVFCKSQKGKFKFGVLTIP